jgi:hypothetical protein
MTKRKQIEENRGRRIGGVAVGVRTLALLIVVAFLALVTPSLCLAQVQLPAVNLGDTNFEDAFGGPGWLLQELPEFYLASELKDSHGETIPEGNRVTAINTTTHLAYLQGIRDGTKGSRRDRECKFTDVNDEIHAPMGGVRDSGWGRTGPRSLDDFSDLIWINSHSGQRQYAF